MWMCVVATWKWNGRELSPLPLNCESNAWQFRCHRFDSHCEPFRLQGSCVHTMCIIYFHWLTNRHTHTHPFNGPLSRTTRVSRYQKGKANLDLNEARDNETLSGSGISWAVCKSAHRSRQITTPAPLHSVFYRPDAIPATQPTASKHWRQSTEGIFVLLHSLFSLVN